MLSTLSGTVRRALRASLTVAAATVGLVAVGGLTQGAAACPGGGVAGGCEPSVDGHTVTVSVTGSLVRGGSDGGGGAGATTVSVPVPCYLRQSWTGKEYFDGIQDRSITGAGWDEWADRPWAPYAGYEDHKDDTEGHWYTPTCVYNDQFPFDEWEDHGDAYFLTYPHTYVEAGEDPPLPPVPPEVLLEAAQEAMEVPEPAFEHNPDATGAIDTLVNMETWLWLTDPMQEGSVTASVPTGDSVTVDATLASVTFSSPAAGVTACDDTGTAYAPGAASDCTLVFESAGATDVTADTEWTLEWSFNGEPQGAIDPLVASFTDGLVVGESQALVDRVG